MSRLQQLSDYIARNPSTYVSKAGADSVAAEVLWDARIDAEEQAVLAGLVSSLTEQGFTYESPATREQLTQLSEGRFLSEYSAAGKVDRMNQGMPTVWTAAKLDELVTLVLGDGKLDAAERSVVAKVVSPSHSEIPSAEVAERVKALVLRDIGSAAELLAAAPEARTEALKGLLDESAAHWGSLRSLGVTESQVLNGTEPGQGISFGRLLIDGHRIPEAVSAAAQQRWEARAGEAGEGSATPNWESIHAVRIHGEDLGYKLTFGYQRLPEEGATGMHLEVSVLFDAAGNLLDESHFANELHPPREDCSGTWTDPERFPPQGWEECDPQSSSWEN
jgi:hypothetical protein